ncbi:phage adaptor protein [Desulfotalea psychrophila]|uniref:Uncharacterized protein n=1 Tax=Desulfotalea psychrophila (strain LSv54 / DSM 12343) TaxID=177439 RepID=Q6ALP6_DESPS|nr:hypothetical protein [Desulfotalea psychrophila]CAG36729.1 unknown protein [Desulfotalea psychrophila LSv54]
MKTTDLVAQFRRVTGDKVTPYLWDDDTIVSFFNAAIDEACLRRDFIFESNTDGLSNLVLREGELHADISGSLYKIDIAHFLNSSGQRTDLEIRSRGDLSFRNNLPDLQAVGDPAFLITDDKKIFILPPPPFGGGIIELEGYRTPLASEKLSLNDVDSEPVISERHHSRLHHWAVYLALSDVDLDSYAPQVAAVHLEKFEDYFGDMLRANRQRLNSQNRPHRNHLW